MSMIFDGFKTREDAEKFVASIETRFGLSGAVYDTADASYAADPFPFELCPPIAHIDRASEESADDEERIEEEVESVAKDFGGTFAGT